MRRYLRVVSVLAPALALAGCSVGAVQQVIHPCPAADLGSPVWSPDSAKLAFQSHHESGSHVMVVEVETGRSRPIYPLEYAGWPLAWSEDGGEVLLESRESSGAWLVIARADGSGAAHRLSVPSQDNVYGFDWRPDGSQIAMGTEEGVVMLSVGTGQETTLIDQRWAMLPDWSPDGRHIAYYGRGGIEGDQRYLAIASGDGQRLEAAISGVEFSVGWWWSPDGTMLGYIGEPSGLMVARPDGSAPTVVIPSIQYPTNWAWLPDSSGFLTLAMDVNARTWTVERVGLDGTATALGMLPVVPMASDEYLWLAFSPDGEQVAYLSQDSGLPELYVAGVDGSDFERLTSNPGHRTCTDWPF